MADPRFFTRQGPFTLEEIAARIGAEVAVGDPARQMVDVAPLDAAGSDNLSFFENRKYAEAFRNSAAGACLLAQGDVEMAPEGMACLVCNEPYRAYAKAAAMFYPAAGLTGRTGTFGQPGVHPAATVHESVKLADDVTVEPGAVIGEGAEIGARSVIGANSVIGRGVAIGSDCWIGPNVTVAYALVGDRVILHPGVRIGQDGFGFAMGATHDKIPQLGRVIIQDEVEIGSNCTIDRGAGPDTVIGAGSKLDDMIHIGHNNTLGRGCVIVAMVGISGSCEIGDYVVMGGQAATSGHQKIGSGAMIAARAGVTRDVPAGAKVGGFPAKPLGEWQREVAALSRLAKRRGKPSPSDGGSQ